jgi:GAF domain-containing protein
MPVVTRTAALPADGPGRAPRVTSAAAEYLRLVLDDAAAIEYEGPLVRARAAGADAGTLAELEDVRLLALQVRAAFAARRRRESELSALFDTASDLATLRGVDSVLTAIVRRARQLLGTDVSYLTLNDDTHGDTYMRVTDGSVSARFQALRLPMGAGLGGLVAQTAAPYATSSYFTDPRFRHTDAINGGVHEEGLVAILGVPLIRGSQVIGVLYAADRTERTFDRSEVALLGSLAAHAAIALDNARLLEETRTALEELSAATRELRAHTASVERAAGAHDRFIDVVLRGGGVEDVAAAVTEALGGRITVLDEEGRPTGGDDGGAALPPDPAGALAMARSTGRTVRDGEWWTAAVTVDSDLLGGLVLQRADDLADSDQRILERAALVTALLLLIRRTASEAEGRVRGELLDELLTVPLRDPDGLRERARRLGADLDRPLSVVVVRVEERGRGRALAAAAHLATTRAGLAGQRDGRVVLCLPDLAAGDAAALVCRELTAAVGRPVTAGGAGPVHGPAAVAGACAEAGRCASTLEALGRAGQSAGAEELGFVGLLVGEGRDVPGFVTATLAPVLEYDARRGTDLVATLRAWFDAGGSPARAAEVLNVHVNTVTQRLDRVGRLLGRDWSAPERALEVQLALRLHRLTSADEPQAAPSGGSPRAREG